MKSNSTKPLMTLDEAKDSVSDVAVMEEQIATGCVDGRLRVYDVRMGRAFVDVIGRECSPSTPRSRWEDRKFGIREEANIHDLQHRLLL
jgi:hypothetical protein